MDLCNGKSRLHISAYGIQKNQKPVDLIVVLDPVRAWQNMLIFGGLCPLSQCFMPFYLSNNGQKVNVAL